MAHNEYVKTFLDIISKMNGYAKNHTFFDYRKRQNREYYSAKEFLIINANAMGLSSEFLSEYKLMHDLRNSICHGHGSEISIQRQTLETLLSIYNIFCSYTNTKNHYKNFDFNKESTSSQTTVKPRPFNTIKADYIRRFESEFERFEFNNRRTTISAEVKSLRNKARELMNSATSEQQLLDIWNWASSTSNKLLEHRYDLDEFNEAKDAGKRELLNDFNNFANCSPEVRYKLESLLEQGLREIDRAVFANDILDAVNNCSRQMDDITYAAWAKRS